MPGLRPHLAACSVNAAPGFWITLLACGCEYRSPHQLKPGDYIGCTSLRHQAPQRVVSVSPVSAVPAPGEAGIQGELWEAAA